MINLETPKFLMGIYEKFVYFDNFEWSYLKPSKGVNRKRSFENESERKAFKTQKDISVSADHIEKEKVKEPSDSVQKPKSQ